MTQETNQRQLYQPRKRLSPEDLEARTRAVVIMTLAGVLLFSVCALLYSLIFVYQPAEQSPNDAAFLKILELDGRVTNLEAAKTRKKSV